MKNDLFTLSYQCAGLSDIGRKRQSNQDRVILCPQNGFFAVSDGMGGLRLGEEAAEYVAGSMPPLIDLCVRECKPDTPPEEAAGLLSSMAQMLSDQLYRQGNERRFDYGATLVGAWLYRDKAIFLGLGDSRGYLVRDGKLNQVTLDMNVAGLMVKNGQMTREEAAHSPASSRLTAFVGMEAPATPETYIVDIRPGDALLLCSDGLYGVSPEQEITAILGSGKAPEEICRDLIASANRHGGRDNISAVFVRIE